ncbi:unnamed protein product, partial [Clonostachys rosea]
AVEATTTATVTTKAAPAKLTEVAVGTAPTTTTATRSTAAATAEGRFASDSLKEGWDLLVGFFEELHKLSDDTTVATVEEGGGNTRVSSTTSTTDTVNIVVDVSGEVIIDDVGDIGDIETTCSNGSGNEDGAASISEEFKGTLTFTLGTITVNGGGGEVLVNEEVGERVRHALRLDEDEGQAAGMGVENVKEDRALVNIFNVFDTLSRTDTTNGKENVVLQEVPSEHLDIAGEGGREHQSLAIGNSGHILALDNATDLRLETHVQHTISLVKDQVLDVAKGNATTLYEIDQSSGSSNKQIAATLNLTELGANIGTTVDDAGSNPGSVGEFARLIINLRNEFSGRGENQRSRVGLALASETTTATGRGRDRRRSVQEGLRKDREEETTSFTGTSLGTGHQITATRDNGDGVLLDRCGDLVVSELDVAAQMLIQRRAKELVDRLWHVTSRSLDGNVVILLEVDTSVLLGRVVDGTKELTLDSGTVGRCLRTSGGWGRTTAVDWGRSIRLAVAHMRGNVGTSSGRRALLALRSQVEPTHVELVRHIR